MLRRSKKRADTLESNGGSSQADPSEQRAQSSKEQQQPQLRSATPLRNDPTPRSALPTRHQQSQGSRSPFASHHHSSSTSSARTTPVISTEPAPEATDRGAQGQSSQPPMARSPSALGLSIFSRKKSTNNNNSNSNAASSSSNHHYHHHPNTPSSSSLRAPNTGGSQDSSHQVFGGRLDSFADATPGPSSSSPNKKGLWNRDRRGSPVLPEPSGSATSANLRTRGHPDPTMPRYSPMFSKSQGDLHTRPTENASPGASAHGELPRIPTFPSDDRYLAASPSLLAINVSKSVEDLKRDAMSSHHTGAARSPSPSYAPQAGQSMSYGSSPGGLSGGPSWRHQGWSPGADAAKMAPVDAVKSRQSSNSSGVMRAPSPSAQPQSTPFPSSHSVASTSQWPVQRGASPSPDPASQMEVSGGSSGQQRPASRMPPSSDAMQMYQGYGQARERKGTSSSLTSSFSLGNVAAGATSVMDKLRGAGGSVAALGERRPSSSADSIKDASVSAGSASGYTHQGFLNRNANVNVQFSQLGVRDREKDVSKGWKPYKVVLKDSALHFYKPPNNVADEVKGSFPTTLLPRDSSSTGGTFTRGFGSQPFDAEMLKQSGLGTRDLLLATSGSSGTVGQGTGNAASPMSPRKTLPLPPSTGAGEAVAPSSSTPAQMEPQVAWHLPGKHIDLVLVVVPERPSHWVERIQSGTLEALVHEYVFASQLTAGDEKGDVAQMAQTLLFSSLSGLQPVPVISLITQFQAQAQVSLAMRGDAATRSFAEAIAGRVACFVDNAVSQFADSLDEEAMSALMELVRSIDGVNIDIRRLQRSAEAERPTCTDWCKLKTAPSTPKLASLAQGHFSAADLLSLDPPEIASQIQVFHADVLRAVTIPRLTVASLLSSNASTQTAKIFSFNGQQPHYLTRVILDQVLDPQHADPAGARATTAAQQARHRASLLRHWIAIASYSLSYGDLVAWTAIIAALCSRAIARLEHTWRLVAEGDRTLLATSWSDKLAKLNWNEDGAMDIDAALVTSSITSRSAKTRDGKRLQAIPFLGDALVRATALRASIGASYEPNGQLPIAAVATQTQRVYQMQQSWIEQTLKGRSSLSADAITAIDAPIVEFQQLLQSLSTSMLSESSRPLGSYVEASLRLEPRTLGNLKQGWVPPLPPSLAAKAILPLVFPAPLLHLDLLDHEHVSTTAALDDQRSKLGHLTRSDPDATIRAQALGSNKYVRSPLSGTPMMRASWQSLARFRGADALPGDKGSRAMLLFSKVPEWNAAVPPGEEIVHRFGTDLLLVATNDGLSSLPSSPLATKRFSQDISALGGTRPVSQISRRSSLPSTSNRSSIVESLVPTTVAIKAATLERIVDVLVLGVDDLFVPLPDEATDPPAGSHPQSSAAVKRSRLAMDLQRFRLTFLATFRSTCSPITLFELLRARFFAAVDAGREIQELPQLPNVSRFPSWSTIVPSAPSTSESVDWDYVAKVRNGVISVLSSWLQHYVQDFVDDTELYDGLISFPASARAATAIPEDGGLAKAVSSLDGLVTLLRSGAFKVNARQGSTQARTRPTPSRSPMHSQPLARERSTLDLDAATAEEFVDYLEGIAGVFFDKITERDLLIVTELFERQARDPLGWHVQRENASEEPQAFTMCKLMELLRTPSSEDIPRSPHSPQGQTPTASASRPISEKLPATVRDACAAQSLLRGWIAINIVEPYIGLQRRQARIEKLLDAIWISRARMLNARALEPGAGLLPREAPLQEATIASFVEVVIVASLTAPESRMFVRGWQGACHARGGSGETLDDLWPSAEVAAGLNAATQRTATPDVGWLLRSLAQAVSRKTAAAQVDSTFVDFARLQITHDLIQSSLTLRQRRDLNDESEAPNATVKTQSLAEIAGHRLGLMQAQMRGVTWDRSAFKEDAAQEASSAASLPCHSSYRAIRPLCKIALDQSDKQERDRNAYEGLRSALDAAKSTAARSPLLPMSDVVGRTSTSSTNTLSLPPGNNPPMEKKSRRMTSLWRGTRGLGGALVSSSSTTLSNPVSTRSTTSELLAATPTTQKASLVVGLGGAECSVWNNSQRSFIFHISSFDGQRILLQAATQQELAEWLSHIEKAVREAAIVAPSPLIGPRRKIGRGNQAQSSPVMPLFGLDITTLVEREGRPIPLGLQRMLAEVEARGLHEIGIYRISGSKSVIDAMVQALRTKPADSIDLQRGEFSDVHTITNVIKLWFRELPEPVVPFSFYDQMIEAQALESHNDRLISIRDLIWAFPKPHFDVLKRVCEHLSRIVEEKEHNKMEAHNLALIFATSLLNPAPSGNSFGDSFGQLGQKSNLIKIMIEYCDWIFEPEPEPEQDAGAEAETEVCPEAGLTHGAETAAAGEKGDVLGDLVVDTGTPFAVGLSGPQGSTSHEDEEMLMSPVGIPEEDEELDRVPSSSNLRRLATSATEPFSRSSDEVESSSDPAIPRRRDSSRAARRRSRGMRLGPGGGATLATSGSSAMTESTGGTAGASDRQLSIYTDALDINLDDSDAVDVRSSLLPDEAMLDVLRAMGTTTLEDPVS
ncbi:unnamed protein product [Jaminaea pallidilutea]